MEKIITYKLFEAKKRIPRIPIKKTIDLEEKFKGIANDVLSELKDIDNGFSWNIYNHGTTWEIDIYYKGDINIGSHYYPEYKKTFKWETVKETISMLVNYLEDIFPKCTFNGFRASLNWKENAIKNKLRLAPDERIVKAYNLGSFMNKLEDNIYLDRISLTSLVRFRGKIT